jgi:pilus assembly protein Flp/PilA
MGSPPRRSGRPPRGEAGQGLVEYALILALIAVVAITALAFFGGNLQTTLSTIGNSVHIQ